MSNEITVKIEGLKRVEEIGYPRPQEESDAYESVFFLSKSMEFRLGAYYFEKQIFWSANGYGGEVWEKDQVLAWAYWMDDYNKDGKGVEFSEIPA